MGHREPTVTVMQCSDMCRTSAVRTVAQHLPMSPLVSQTHTSVVAVGGENSRKIMAVSNIHQHFPHLPMMATFPLSTLAFFSAECSAIARTHQACTMRMRISTLRTHLRERRAGCCGISALMDGGQVVWAPHPEEGYQLGLIVDVSTDTLTVEPLQGGKVCLYILNYSVCVYVY